MRNIVFGLSFISLLVACNPANIKIPPGEISVNQTYDQIPGRTIHTNFTRLGAIDFFIQPNTQDKSETRVYWETRFAQPKNGETLISIYPKPGTSPYKELHFEFSRIHSGQTSLLGYTQPDREQNEKNILKTHVAFIGTSTDLTNTANEVMNLTEELRNSFNKHSQDKQPLSDAVVQKLTTILTKDAFAFPVAWAYRVVPAETVLQEVPPASKL